MDAEEFQTFFYGDNLNPVTAAGDLFDHPDLFDGQLLLFFFPHTVLPTVNIMDTVLGVKYFCLSPRFIKYLCFVWTAEKCEMNSLS